MKGKFPPKVTVFGGIPCDDKSVLITAELGTINAESYVNDFVGQSGIIPDMNQRFGADEWI
jgi:hypothetical protein